MPELGNWRTAHSRFRRWTIAGVWENIFKTLVDNPDFEYVLIDATTSKVHADAAGQKGGLKLTVSVRSDQQDTLVVTFDNLDIAMTKRDDRAHGVLRSSNPKVAQCWASWLGMVSGRSGNG